MGTQANKLIKGANHDLPTYADDMIGIAVDAEDSYGYEDAFEEWWTVAILKPWGEIQPLTVRTDWKIHQMKELLQALTGVCCQHQQLAYAGRQLPSCASIMAAM